MHLLPRTDAELIRDGAIRGLTGAIRELETVVVDPEARPACGCCGEPLEPGATALRFTYTWWGPDGCRPGPAWMHAAACA
jgi:hypothetical protein